MRNKVYVLMLLSAFCIWPSGLVRAQNVGIGTVSPDASSLLDMTSTSLGVLVPRMTNTYMLAISSPATGLLIFNTTANTFYYNAGTPGTPNWVPFLSGISGWSLTGNANTTPGTNFLGTTDANDLVFKTNNTEKVRILSGGKVGIGTSAPNVLADINGDLAMRVVAYTASSGNNNDIAIGAYSFVRISGPSATFAITGIAGGQNGKVLVIFNSTSQTMTVTNQDANSTTAADRILTNNSNGSTTLKIAGQGTVTLIYSSTDSRWLVLNSSGGGSGSGSYVVRKTADQSVTSSTTFVDDNDLQVAISANQVLQIEGMMDVTGGGGDFDFEITGPAGATANLTYHSNWNGNGHGYLQDESLAIATSSAQIKNGNSDNIVYFSGIVVNGGTTGTVKVRWAQNSSNATATTVKTNSFIKSTVSSN